MTNIFFNFLKYSIKQSLAYFLYFSGILFIYKYIKLKEKALALLYHRVLTLAEQETTFSQNGIIVSDITFNRHLVFLKKHFNIIDAAEFSRIIEEGKIFSDSSCLITFDDGWKDNYTNAFPLLKNQEIPSLIFLSVNYIENDDLFWQETLNIYLKVFLSETDSSILEEKNLIEFIERYELNDIIDSSDENRKIQILNFINNWKFKPEKKRIEFLKSFNNILDIDITQQNKCDYFMNWDDIGNMESGNITFGSHGMNHKIVTQLSNEQLNEELSESKIELGKKLSKNVDTFSYPNGNYDQETAKLVENLGYQFAFTTEYGFVDKNCNLMTIPRINIHEDVTNNIPMFLCRILGIF